jgi:predicted ATPase
LLERGLAADRDAGSILWEPFFLVLLADAHARARRPEEGLRHLAEPARMMEATKERRAAAEVYRLDGGLLAELDRPEAAEACFRRALATARQQGAKLWELRAATSLARVWHHQGRREAARNLLAPVYTRLTEGCDTPDLKNAKVLLAGLCG